MKSIKVNILGREFLLKSEADVEHINQAANYVKQKIETIQKTQTMDIISTIILTALNIADDYFQLKKERETLVHSVEDRSIYLLDVIDSRLKESMT